MANSTKLRKRAQQLKGQPVCITLHNGRSYVGWITDLNQEAVILSRPGTRKGPKRKSSSAARRAEVSGFMPLLGSLMGGEAGLPVSAEGWDGSWACSEWCRRLCR